MADPRQPYDPRPRDLGTWLVDPATVPVTRTRWPLWLRLWRRLHPGTSR